VSGKGDSASAPATVAAIEDAYTNVDFSKGYIRFVEKNLMVLALTN
jgi:hypothetical protein